MILIISSSPPTTFPALIQRPTIWSSSLSSYRVEVSETQIENWFFTDVSYRWIPKITLKHFLKDKKIFFKTRSISKQRNCAHDFLYCETFALIDSIKVFQWIVIEVTCYKQYIPHLLLMTCYINAKTSRISLWKFDNFL